MARAKIKQDDVSFLDLDETPVSKTYIAEDLQGAEIIPEVVEPVKTKSMSSLAMEAQQAQEDKELELLEKQKLEQQAQATALLNIDKPQEAAKIVVPDEKTETPKPHQDLIDELDEEEEAEEKENRDLYNNLFISKANIVCQFELRGHKVILYPDSDGKNYVVEYWTPELVQEETIKKSIVNGIGEFQFVLDCILMKLKLVKVTKDNRIVEVKEKAEVIDIKKDRPRKS